MKMFVIRYVTQVLFGQGFCLHVDKALGAIAAHRALERIRSGKNPAIKIWVTIE